MLLSSKPKETKAHLKRQRLQTNRNCNYIRKKTKPYTEKRSQKIAVYLVYFKLVEKELALSINTNAFLPFSGDLKNRR